VPPPRTNLIRYHGVLAPAATDRDRIVPGPSTLTAADGDVADGSSAGGPVRHHRGEWARLLARVFPFDVAHCPDCGGHMQEPNGSIIAAITAPASIRKVLDALGLPARAPPIAPARFQQLELDAA
jgi:hypothetical protein